MYTLGQTEGEDDACDGTRKSDSDIESSFFIPATLTQLLFVTEPVTEQETKPVTKPENVPETEPENVPETEPENVPETKPENVPETKPVTVETGLLISDSAGKFVFNNCTVTIICKCSCQKDD